MDTPAPLARLAETPKSNIQYLHRGLILALALSFLVVVGKYVYLQKKLTDVQQTLLASDTINDKVLNFTKLFIQKVLKARGEISFETRLQLENSVRDLDDAAVLAAWQAFVDSTTELEAQNAVKDLLDILVGKIRA